MSTTTVYVFESQEDTDFIIEEHTHETELSKGERHIAALKELGLEKLPARAVRVLLHAASAD